MLNKSNSLHGSTKIHVLQIVGDPVGGIRKHVHSIIEGLDSSTFLQSYAYSTLSTDSKFKQDIEHLRTNNLMEILPLPIRKKPHLSDLKNLLQLVRYIKSSNVNLIHGHGAKAGLYARILAQICGITSIYTPHGGVAHAMFSKFEDLLYVSVEKLLFSITGYFIFESKYTATAFGKKLGRIPKNCMINYNGIPMMDMNAVARRSVALGYSLRSSDIPQVGVFGMLREVKGQSYAIKAIALLLAKGHKIHLHIFGDGPDLQDLQHLVSQLNLEEYVTFAGDVSDPESHMVGMDIILVPSLHESFGYVAAEAMALGKPVIASNVGGLAEVLDSQTGILVEPGNEAAIADAIIYGIQNQDAISNIAKQGYLKFMSNFTLNRMVNNLASKYTELQKVRN